jgi:hypothetical protein
MNATAPKKGGPIKPAAQAIDADIATPIDVRAGLACRHRQTA